MPFTEHVKVRHEKHGSVIFDTLSEKVFVLNQTGGRIAQLVKDGNSEQQIVAALCESFDADPEAMAQDVRRFLCMLEENNLTLKEEA